jgi:demethylmenaquinone methyltransferase/2-methoxy-6-polyprenyl-1,4-benzoquinol methylase
MIPFNHLGWFFNLCDSTAYPSEAVDDLCLALKPLQNGALILDLGAGTGIMSNYAHACRNDLRFVAADPAEGMLKYVPEHIQTVNAVAESLPFDSDRFDAVLVGEAIHHFQEPASAFEEIARVLKNGGLLFVYEFDPSTFLGAVVHYGERLLGEPGNFYTPEALQKILQQHGFDVVINRHGWRYTVNARLIQPN